MRYLFERLLCFFRKTAIKVIPMESFIFYKVVDTFSLGNNKYYYLQCINTAAILKTTLTEIIFDTDLLYGLHPIQACYLGLEYASCFFESSNNIVVKTPTSLPSVNTCRYGKFMVCSQDRAGNIHFKDIASSKMLIKQPFEIAFSKELIANFDAIQAFYIGLQAGFKFKKTSFQSSPKLKRYLKVVK